MTDFNADDLMNSSVNGAMETSFIPVPEGEYRANISKVAIRQAKDSILLDVTWEIDDDAVRSATGIDNPQVRQSLFLDINESGSLDLGKGKNVGLGRLREAVGQNGPGAWAPGQLMGCPAMVRVSHRSYNNQIFADVKGVSAL